MFSIQWQTELSFIRVMEHMHVEENQEFAPVFIIHSSFSVEKKMISHIHPLLPKNNMYWSQTPGLKSIFFSPSVKR